MICHCYYLSVKEQRTQKLLSLKLNSLAGEKYVKSKYRGVATYQLFNKKLLDGIV